MIKQIIMIMMGNILSILLLSSLVKGDYTVVNAFPNLSFTDPVGVYYAGDGSDQLFVLEQPGTIKVLNNDAGITNVHTFLNITSIVEQDPGYTEEGLLGLAFHPNYVENGYFYVNYTDYSPKRNVISRYTVSSTDPNQADTESALVIIEVNQPYTNHNGGQMGFGSDGYLYISFGDGGSAGDPQGNGQNLQTLLGTIIRIDVDTVSRGENYSIPSDNPFVSNVDARDEIYAYGLRNMWRFSWDPVTDLLWGADVGQYDWEEIDIIYPGLNYGWNTMEGNHCYPAGTNCNTDGFQPPVFEYPLYVNGVCSVTGGFVYRGDEMASLYGKYIYGDWCTGDIWAFTYSDDGNQINEHLITSGINITSFGLDQHNELLICANSNIYKLISDEVDYESQIQTIFNDRCISCHGSMGGLNLASYENLMEGGLSGDVIIPYDHASSELWQRINSGQMPPGNNDLTGVQVDLIAQWIDEGALLTEPTSSCDEGYAHIVDLPDNLVNSNNEEQCFFNDDLEVIANLISLNGLNELNMLETGVQSWNAGRLFSWVLTYSPNGSNGVNEQLTVLPENIGNLSSLGSLYIEWNHITVLPESFAALTNLSNLVISNNLLTSLPDNFGNLMNLFFLDLGYNQINSMPESIGFLQNIMYFWIFNNHLSQLPESICNLPLIWDGVDFGNFPYFASGGNQLCESDLIPDCVENSSNFEISLDQFYYSFPEDSPQDCPGILTGDLNLDGIINILDIVLMVNMVLDDSYDEVADMNDDGVINILDIVILINTILS